MSDGKDLKVELTFYIKPIDGRHYLKKRAESKRQPTSSAGEWPRQLTAATRPTASRPTLQVLRTTPHLERKTPPPSTQTFQHQSETITLPRYKTTTTITASPTIYRLTPSTSPQAPPDKKTRIASPNRDFADPPKIYYYNQIKDCTHFMTCMRYMVASSRGLK